MRKKRSKHRPTLNILFVIIVFMSFVSVGYSYLSGVLKITGNITGKIKNDYVILPGSNPNLEATIMLTKTWQEGTNYKYQYSFSIKNIGSNLIDVFTLTVNFLNNVDSVVISNYDYKLSGKALTITNTNYTISPNSYLLISLTLTTKTSTETVKSIKFDIPQGTVVGTDKFNVKFNITSSSGQYVYQYDVILTNNTGSKVNAWQLDVTLPSGTTFISGSSAIYSFSNQLLTIKNESSNGHINNGSSITIGLQLSTNVVNYIPTNIKVTVR